MIVSITSARPPNAPIGRPPPIDFARHNEVGLHAELARRSPVAGGDAGLDLVEDEHRAVALGDLAHCFEVAGLGKADADVLHHRLEDERGDLTPIGLEHTLERGEVVERDDESVVQHRGCEAARRRHADRCVRGTGEVERRLHRDHHLVVMAVIAAFDLDDLRATRVAARGADRVHRRLGAAVRESHEVEAEPLDEQLRDVRVALARRHVQRAVLELLLDRLDHHGMAMTREQRAVAHVEVDVAVAVDVLEPGPLGSTGDDGIGVVELERRGHSQGQHLRCTRVRGMGLRRSRRVRLQLPLSDLAGTGSKGCPVAGGRGHGYHFPTDDPPADAPARGFQPTGQGPLSKVQIRPARPRERPPAVGRLAQNTRRPDRSVAASEVGWLHSPLPGHHGRDVERRPRHGSRPFGHRTPQPHRSRVPRSPRRDRAHRGDVPHRRADPRRPLHGRGRRRLASGVERARREAPS